MKLKRDSEFDPRLIIEPLDRDRDISITKEDRDPRRLSVMVERLQKYFPQAFSPTLTWGRQVIKGNVRKFDLIRIKDRGEKVIIHPIFAHPRVPADIFEAVIFLALLMAYFTTRQEGYTGHPFDEERAVAWIESQMAMVPGAEFLSRLFSRFAIWIARL